jgi:hypothetical protein
MTRTDNKCMLKSGETRPLTGPFHHFSFVNFFANIPAKMAEYCMSHLMLDKGKRANNPVIVFCYKGNIVRKMNKLKVVVWSITSLLCSRQFLKFTRNFATLVVCTLHSFLVFCWRCAKFKHDTRFKSVYFINQCIHIRVPKLNRNDQPIQPIDGRSVEKSSNFFNHKVE